VKGEIHLKDKKTRADVNVSCHGGTRVEIKGVAHTSWMPELAHNEAFRQWALLHIKGKILQVVKNPASWKPTSKEVSLREVKLDLPAYHKDNKSMKICIVNLPFFQGRRCPDHFLGAGSRH